MQIFPKNTPKLMRRVVIWAFLIQTLLGLTIALTKIYDPSIALFNFLVFDLAALIADGCILILYHTMCNYGVKAVMGKCAELYRQKSYCGEMAECAQKTVAVPRPSELLLTLFWQVMSEHYTDMNVTLLKLEQQTLTQRQEAALLTCVIRRHAMTGHMDTAEDLFKLHADTISAYYAIEPELWQPYAHETDDALVFYELAAAMATRTKDTRRAAEYQKRYAEQLCWRGERMDGITAQRRQNDTPSFAQKIEGYKERSERECAYRQRLMELNLLYAARKHTEGREMEHVMRAEIETANPPLPPGLKTEFLRMLEQASIFGVTLSNDPEIDLTARKLPPA